VVWIHSCKKKVSPNKQCSPEICFQQFNPPFWQRGIILLVCSSDALVSGVSLSVRILKQGRINQISDGALREVCHLKSESIGADLSHAERNIFAPY